MYIIRPPIYQTQQIRTFEALAQEKYGISGQAMMDQAGKAAFEFLLRRWPQAKRIAVLCGSGNNGGDGYVIGRFAHEHGLETTIWQVGDHHNLKAEAKEAFVACQNAHVPIIPFGPRTGLNHPDLIVDAICGVGLQDELRDEAIVAIEHMQSACVPIFAIDVPTGINADTGAVMGKAVNATATITFIGLKMGLLTGRGMAFTGELVLNDLHLPSEMFALVPPVAEKAVMSTYMEHLRPRPRDCHKGQCGHVLIIGGELGCSGAPRMAAEAALRTGAGLASIATRPEHALAMNSSRPEIMCHGVSTTDQLQPLIEQADVIIVGPGLGQTNWGRTLWQSACHARAPLVVDADGLNLLSAFPEAHENWILTPHPGEAARLLGISAQAVQSDRLAAVKGLHKQYGGTCVLKGAGTLILAPGTLPVVCDKGNPGMASAGMGDVLSGVIGGLVAQGVPLGDAAKLGACLHAMAGDMAARSGERGTLAMDLMPFLRQLVNG